MQQSKEQQANRIYEQPPDAISFYSDFAQIVGTGREIVLQFYETIPGPPSLPDGKITAVRTRLRATITVSIAHAANIGKLMLGQVEVEGKGAGGAEPRGAESS